MKRLLLSLIIGMMCSLSLCAQDENLSQYLFPEFEEAQVIYRNGRAYNVKVNYNLVGNRFLFIDTYDNDILKEFADVENVGVIKVGERLFMITNKGIVQESLQTTKPRILVEYKGKVKDLGQKAAYGGRSQTSAIESITTFNHSGMTYRLDNDPRYVISGVNKRYYVEKDKKMKSFTTVKQFTKIFSSHKAEIEKYIKDNNIDFDSVEDVIILCNYADSLM